jgi:hypothetical protein
MIETYMGSALPTVGAAGPGAFGDVALIRGVQDFRLRLGKSLVRDEIVGPRFWWGVRQTRLHRM